MSHPKGKMIPDKCWKGAKRKPREVMTILPDYRRSRGVCAYYCVKDEETGKMVPDER